MLLDLFFPFFGVSVMFTKVVAGLVAAVAVAGAGVYFAPSSNCSNGCPLSRLTDSSASDSTGCQSCCTDSMSCTAPEPNESLAACAGAATLVSTGSPKVAAPACCAE